MYIFSLSLPNLLKFTLYPQINCPDKIFKIHLMQILLS